jgi:F-type H+-transporting ATPase subunit a
MPTTHEASETRVVEMMGAQIKRGVQPLARTWILTLAVTALVLCRANAAQDKHPPADHEMPKADHDAHAAHGAHKEHSAMEHVMDADEWQFFDFLPALPLPFGLTKFVVLEIIAALLIAAIYIPLAQRLRTGRPPRGAFENSFEVLLTFVRNEIARPSIGEHDADRFVPFLWTMFLFILFNNLLGLVPFGASATASIYVTGGLAVIVFFAIHGSAIAKMGFVHYVQSLWPDMEVPFGLGYAIKPLVFLIEVISVVVRNLVLAVRLFANMFAGHMVLATILLFIKTASVGFALWGAITISSVLGIIALSLLELFVAFLQAYIFVFLTALFMGLAMHPQH